MYTRKWSIKSTIKGVKMNQGISSSPSGIIQNCLDETFTNNRAVLKIACQQRAKFEGWLKFELAVSLAQRSAISEIIFEDGYGEKKRSDLSFVFDSRKWFVEMKTANTSWRVEGVKNKTRPITMNIDGISEDIQILKENCLTNQGIDVFILFPVPYHIWKYSSEKLLYHLNRIEKSCDFSPRSLLDFIEYFEVDKEYGVISGVVIV